MKFSDLTTYQPQELYQVFNDSFADYAVPVTFTAQQFQRKIEVEDIKLESSIVAVDNGQLVGIILHALREISGEKVLYNAGTGVIPGSRGVGLAQRMYQHILSIVRDDNAQRIVLEVLTSNVPAIKTYTNLGFAETRKFHCYQGDIEHRSTKADVTIAPISLAEFERYASMGEVVPSWQNATASILRSLDVVELLGAYKGEVLSGCCALDTSRNRLLQIVVHPDHRRCGVASAMLHHIASKHGKKLSIINVDSRAEDLHHFLLSQGLQQIQGQYEMELML